MTRNPIDNISDVVYETVKSTRSVRHLHMSFLVPRTSFLKPAIIYFPGGGFMTAEHNKFMEMRMALAEAGFVVAAAEYRTIPDIFPAPIVDAKAAVRYLRQHAPDYGIDPSRIGVFGDSAGGWLAQMLGTTNIPLLRHARQRCHQTMRGVFITTLSSCTINTSLRSSL